MVLFHPPPANAWNIGAVDPGLWQQQQQSMVQQQHSSHQQYMWNQLQKLLQPPLPIADLQQQQQQQQPEQEQQQQRLKPEQQQQQHGNQQQKQEIQEKLEQHAQQPQCPVQQQQKEVELQLGDQPIAARPHVPAPSVADAPKPRLQQLFALLQELDRVRDSSSGLPAASLASDPNFKALASAVHAAHGSSCRELLLEVGRLPGVDYGLSSGGIGSNASNRRWWGEAGPLLSYKVDASSRAGDVSDFLFVGLPMSNAQALSIVQALDDAFKDQSTRWPFVGVNVAGDASAADATSSATTGGTNVGRSIGTPRELISQELRSEVDKGAQLRRLPVESSSPLVRLAGERCLRSTKLQLRVQAGQQPMGFQGATTHLGPLESRGDSAATIPLCLVASLLHVAPTPTPMLAPRFADVCQPIKQPAPSFRLEQMPTSMWQLHCWSAGCWCVRLHYNTKASSKRCYLSIACRGGFEMQPTQEVVGCVASYAMQLGHAVLRLILTVTASDLESTQQNGAQWGSVEAATSLVRCLFACGQLMCVLPTYVQEAPKRERVKQERKRDPSARNHKRLERATK